MLDLAVVIVAWNNADIISAALRSLLDDLHASSLRHQVWLVDSASGDGTADLVARDFPEVSLIRSRENIGFGRGNNLALREIGILSDESLADLPKATYLLNPDTVTQPGACKALFDALFAMADAGVVGARLHYADGSFQHSAFAFPGLRQIYSEFFPLPGRFREGAFNGRYAKTLYAGDAPFEVDFVLGATMMFKSEVLRQCGGFDERFFMYCEEIDLQWRARQRGWKAICAPTAQVTHLGGGSSSQARPASLYNLWKSRLQLCDKHYPAWKRKLARKLIIAGMRRRIRAMTAADSALAEACQRVIDLART